MSENMFGDFADDIADAPDDPFGLSDGTYRGAIIKVEKKSGTKRDSDIEWAGLEVELSSADHEETHVQFFSLPTAADKESTRKIKLSSLKKFLTGCGIPRERMNVVEPDDIIGLDVVYTIRTSKNGFKNLDISLAKGETRSIRPSESSGEFDFGDL